MDYKYLVCTRCFTFNQSNYIEDAMNGFAMQETTFPFVTVIIDDASTDGEPDVIRKYLREHFQEPFRNEETEYANIICANHKNNPNSQFVVLFLKYNHYSIKKDKFKYLTEWLNNAKYHAICEGDDYWIDSMKLQKQVSFLESHSDFGLIASACRSFVQLEQHFYDAVHDKEMELTFEDLLFDNGFATCTVLFKKEYTIEYKNTIKKRWQTGDYPLWLYIALQARVYRLADCTAVYRVLQSSASHSKDPEKALAFKLSTMDCTNYFVDKYGLEESKAKELYKQGAQNLLRRGMFFQYRPFVTEAISYLKKHNLPVGFRYHICYALLSMKITKRAVRMFQRIRKFIKKNVLKNIKR